MNENSKQYLSLILGALFHDIGKFIQRSETWTKNKIGRHQELSRIFIDPNETIENLDLNIELPERWIENKNINMNQVKEIVHMHHQRDLEKYNFKDNLTKILASIVCESDSLSSGEREKIQSDSEDYLGENSPLISLLPKIFNQDNKLFYNTRKLQIGNKTLYPQPNIKAEYSKIYNDFIKEFNQFLSKFTEFDLPKIETLTYILKKYLWSVPSAYYIHEPDISLYEHLRMTAAIASCMYKFFESELDNNLDYKKIFNRDEIRYRLLCGDICGIQNYIYNISSTKAGKSLKGRSFYIQLLSDTFSDMIIKEFGLSNCNLLYSAGGKFYCLLPELEDTDKKLINLDKKINQYLLEKYSGNLFLALGSIKLKGSDFLKDKETGGYNISDKWREVNIEVGKKKNNKFSNLLKENTNVELNYNKIFCYPEEAGEKEFCEICSKELENNSEICSECEEKIKIGENLRFANIIVKIDINKNEFKEDFYLDLDKDKIIDFSEIGYLYFLAEDKREFENDISAKLNYFNNVFIYNINYSDNFLFNILEKNKIGTGYKFIGIGKREIFDTEQICNSENNNLNRLGILRMDIDNLGNLFINGIGEKKTISRIVQLSFYIDFYFSAIINKFVDKKYNNDVYFQDTHIIYSGGDDLFLIGRWDEIPKIALAIYKDFRNFTKNEKISISGGIYLARRKFPISKSAVESGIAEENSKNYSIKGISKNAITFLGKTLNFNDFEKVSEIVKLLKIYSDDSRNGLKISKGFIQKLFQIYSMEIEEKIKLRKNKVIAAILRYRWKWIMVYSFTRYIRDKYKKDEDIQLLIKSIQDYLLKDKFEFRDKKYETLETGIQLIGLIARWTELSLRKKSKKEAVI